MYLPHSLHTPYLVDVVAPALSELSLDDAFFFLRYWQGGPHLRLRLSLPEDDRPGDLVEAFVSRLVGGLPELTDAQRDEYEAGLRLQDELARLERESSVPPRAAGTVVPMPYVPETAKYGGARGVAIAEDVFRGTSVEVLDVLGSLMRSGGDDGRAPIGEAARVMVMLVSGAGLSREQAVPFLRAYEEWWSSYAPPRLQESWPRLYPSVDAQMRALCTTAWGEPGPADVLHDIGVRAAAQARESADRPTPTDIRDVTLDGTPFAGCLSNYIHTTNNRLGLVPAAEGMVAYLVRRGIEDLLAG